LCKLTVDCKEQLRTSPSLTNRKAGSTIIHIATANQLNCKKLLLGENGKCWLRLRSMVLLCEVVVWSLFWTSGSSICVGRWRKSEFTNCASYCQLLLCQVSMIKLFGAKLGCVNFSGVYLVPFGCFYKSVFQIDWFIDWRW